MPDTQTATPDERKATIEQALARHSGSLERFRHWTKRIVYTPGVADMAEMCSAHWLIDLVASHQVAPSVRAEEFQVWKLTVAADRTALAVADDGNGREVARQVIEFTDFPLDEMTLWLVNGTLLLPGEY
jgi:hypothetical protein